MKNRLLIGKHEYFYKNVKLEIKAIINDGKANGLWEIYYNSIQTKEMNLN